MYERLLRPLPTDVEGIEPDRRGTKRGRPVLRIVRSGGMEIAVSGTDHAAATLVATTAVHLVRHWGLVSAEAVIERARALAPTTVVGKIEPVARGVLGALPRTRWLGGSHRWFSFVDAESQMAIAIAKVFAITPRIDIEQLRAALAKALPGLGVAPGQVFSDYLTQIAGCGLAGGFVRRAASARSCLTRAETAVVKMLEAAGGELDVKALRQRARTAALPRTTLERLIGLSPLFRQGEDRLVRLVGDGPLPIYA
jgi:hypothetical protein